MPHGQTVRITESYRRLEYHESIYPFLSLSLSLPLCIFLYFSIYVSMCLYVWSVSTLSYLSHAAFDPFSLSPAENHVNARFLLPSSCWKTPDGGHVRVPNKETSADIDILTMVLHAPSSSSSSLTLSIQSKVNNTIITYIRTRIYHISCRHLDRGTSSLPPRNHHHR